MIHSMRNNKDLQSEKKDMLSMMHFFLENFNFEEQSPNGRPSFPLKGIMKCLLVMSYHGWSLRRSQSDIEQIHKDGIISCIPKPSTLNKYMLDSKTEELLERLIILSALPLAAMSDTFIADLTLYQQFMNTCAAHRQKVRKVDLAPHYKTRKLHILMCKETRSVCWAKASGGEVNDSPFLPRMIQETVNEGFVIKKLLADKGYVAKETYALCQELGIKECFIEMKMFYTGKRPGSALWRDQLQVYKNKPEEWHESYRFRVIVRTI